MRTTLFCMFPRTAGIVVGWLGMMSSIMGIIVYVALLMFVNVSASIDVEPAYKSLEENLKDFSRIKSDQTKIFSLCLVGSLIQFVISGLLLLGTYKKRHKLLLPWLILSAIGIVLMCIYIVGICIVGFIFQMPLLHAFIFFVCGVISLAFTVYVFLAIVTLYKELKYAKLNPQGQIMQVHVPGMPLPNTGYSNYSKI